MTAIVSPLLAATSNGTALWYLTRSTGLVAFVLLTASVVVGVVASVGWTTERWPRFLSQNVHRNLSLFCVGFVGIHVVTTVSDGFVPIGFLDAFVPFLTAYRPLWVGLGALSFDLVLAVLVTSALRHRIGFDSWRFVHWLAYLCWPIALFHAMGSGTDTHLPLILLIDVACGGAVVLAVGWRLVTGRNFGIGWRAGAAAATGLVALALMVFVVVGPLRPGWSKRAGTSSALLAQIAAKFSGAAATTTTSPTGGSGTTPQTTAPASGGGSVPTAPFTDQLTGRQTSTGPDAQGNVQVTLSMRLQDAAATPLTVVINGAAVNGGGVAMSSSEVIFGTYHGQVTALQGDTVAAQVATPTPMTLVITLALNQQSGSLSGSVSGTAGGQASN